MYRVAPVRRLVGAVRCGTAHSARVWPSRETHALAEASKRDPEGADPNLNIGSTALEKPKRAQKKGRTRQARLFDELPAQSVAADGQQAQPLAPWRPEAQDSGTSTRKSPTSRTKRKKTIEGGASEPSPGGREEDEEIDVPLLHELGADGQSWPPLAKEVLTNLARFPGCMLLTRVGGFYESYFSQAPELASLLSIKLASRTWGGRTVAMAGFPLSQLEKYLKVLVQDCGKLVAICEEFREFAYSGGAVNAGGEDQDDTRIRRTLNEGVTIKRRVTRVVTPGTLIDEKFLDPFSNNFVLSVSRIPATFQEGATKTTKGQSSHVFGMAWLDVSTADFNTTVCTDAISLRDEIARIAPREVILQSGAFDSDGVASAGSETAESSRNTITQHPLWEAIDKSVLVTYTTDQMEQQSASSASPHIDFTGMTAAEGQAVLFLTSHLQKRLLSMASSALSNSTPLRRDQSEVMHIDSHALAALEIKESLREGGVRGSLASIVRRTLTRGGTRLLGDWLTSPSTNLDTITSRHILVDLFLKNPFLRDDLRLHLRRGAGDVSRVLQKIVTGRSDVQELLEVRDFIATCDAIVRRLQVEHASMTGETVEGGAKDETRLADHVALHRLANTFQSLTDLGSKLDKAIDATVIEKRLRAQEDMMRRVEAEAAGREGVLSQTDTDVEDKEKNTDRLIKKIRAHLGADVDRTFWGQPLEHLIRPNFSRALRALTTEHTNLRRDAKKLEQQLNDQMSNRISLRFLLGQGYVVHFSDFQEKYQDAIEKEVGISGEYLVPAHRTKSTRTFYLRQWTVIGNRMQKLADQLREKESLELERLRQNVMVALTSLRHNSRLIDQLDVLLGFAQLAQELNLVRPVVDDSRDIEIVGGRHLSVEVGLLEAQAARAANEEARKLVGDPESGTATAAPAAAAANVVQQQRPFVANDLVMHADRDTVHLITGPNMGGKSTFLRQNALIAILAQCGSFVPATQARIGIVDRVFSRVGAKDDLFRDRSTFMVEMLETAEILARATPRSLVIADEIGRGTTSEVGLAVAYATVHELYARGCRTLFASHFHEVADMLGYMEHVDGAQGAGRQEGDRFSKVRFFCTDVDESSSGHITYSHQLRPGINRDSHGLKVARIAGMPPRAVGVAEAALRWIQGPSGWSRSVPEGTMQVQLKMLDEATASA